MSASKSKKTNSEAKANDQYVDVLYQKLGENWFAFSLIDDEVFMSPVSDDKITEIKNEGSTRSGNAGTDHEAA